jgi:hypothetical protein
VEDKLYLTNKINFEDVITIKPVMSIGVKKRLYFG